MSRILKAMFEDLKQILFMQSITRNEKAWNIITDIIRNEDLGKTNCQQEDWNGEKKMEMQGGS